MLCGLLFLSAYVGTNRAVGQVERLISSQMLWQSFELESAVTYYNTC
jgi:hypothetical protein